MSIELRNSTQQTILHTYTYLGIICDPPSENQPSSHLVVFREIPF